MSEDAIEQADQLQGAGHPRHTYTLHGQDSAQADFLNAFNSDRMHHAWMITGPKGIGKATLAWRIARFVLSQPDKGGMFDAPAPSNLEVSPDSPVSRRIDALGEPSLFLARRPWDEKAKKLKQNINVDEIRKLKSFFTLSAADGGWRIAIVDSADEMNTAAANALLKVLEEPPEKVLLLLISHQPSRLLPTIRSRCRTLRCNTLAPQELGAALAQSGFEVHSETNQVSVLADGSVGASIELISSEGITLYKSIVQLAGQAPRMDRQLMQTMADACVGKNAVDRYNMTLRLFAQFISRLAKFGALQPADFQEAASGEALTMSKLAPNANAARKWANLLQETTAKTGHARSVNLDPSSVILDMLLTFEETARS
jgi:DNA polymerase-3 subunit delta'